MPLIKSSEKRMRQNVVRRTRLLPFKSHMKTMIKKISELAKGGKVKEAEALLPTVYKAIDTAAKKKVIVAGNANRKKASVAALVAKK